MTTIQIINYGAVEFYTEGNVLKYRDVGSRKWNAIWIGDAEDPLMDISDLVEGYLIPILGCDDSWMEIDDYTTDRINTAGTFITDEAKMRDFLKCSKDEFLFSYSYLTEEEYNATYEAVMNLIGQAVGWDITIAEEFEL